MGTESYKFQVWERLGEHCGMAVAAWAKRWNHWGGLGALECRCVGKGTYQQFMRYHEEMDYDFWLVDLLAWMGKWADGHGDKLHLDYFFVSSQSSSMSLVDFQE